ncbi:winged helix-turn-helix transcriptional regulator [Actinomadura rupiterrae]|uniref:winged helix-turn-helix transcriptional regulator n=1 Tax=Actinomadura rupiterrae TaxID=559627 RepID=UPI0020A46F51|nr:helix-turn-helix domain-containing protein [Actinomadura rupiterrae]MCP2341580.1 DNA-binding HxlR family transcriptional regulator [Actinomadura rupiterrae]
MQRTSFAEMHCSIGQSLERVGEWWTPLIVRDVHLGLHRFDDIAENLGISRNLLTRRLETLVADGIVERRAYQERPLRHEYHLTQAGRELVPVLMALMAWGDKWATPEGGPPVRLVHDGCGAEFTAQVSCSECGEAVTTANVTSLPGPGAAPGPGTRVLHRRAARTPAQE